MLKIYGVPISVHTRKVILAAMYKEIDFEIEPVIPFDPPAGWNDLSPTGKIPAVDHDGKHIADSTVICTYLDRTYPSHALYPDLIDPLTQALWLEEYCDGTLFPQLVHGLFFQKIIRPGMLGEETDVALVDDLLTNVRPKLFGYLETQIDGEFLAGNALSTADFALVCNLINYHYLGFDIDASSYPKLAQYFQRALSWAPVGQALTAEQPFAKQMELNTDFAAPALAA